MDLAPLPVGLQALRRLRSRQQHRLHGGHVPYRAVGEDNLLHLIAVQAEVPLDDHAVRPVAEAEHQAVIALHPLPGEHRLLRHQPLPEPQRVRSAALNNRVLPVFGVKEVGVIPVSALQLVISFSSPQHIVRVFARHDIRIVTAGKCQRLRNT